MGTSSQTKSGASAATGSVVSGILYLVATPIGNFNDITHRAVSILSEVDLIVYEERREAERLLRHFNVQKPVESLNEHNEAAASQDILAHLERGKSVALISDCGTPVFMDSGHLLVRKAIEQHIKVVPIPGASSLMPALIVSGFPIDQFVFHGLLSPKKEQRRKELRELTTEMRTIVLMDTPYRLVPLLQDLADVFGTSRRVCVAYNLTMRDEQVFYGNSIDLHKEFSSRKMKGEFVILIEGKT